MHTSYMYMFHCIHGTLPLLHKGAQRRINTSANNPPKKKIKKKKRRFNIALHFLFFNLFFHVHLLLLLQNPKNQKKEK